MLESAVIANEFAAVSVKVVRQGRGLRLRLAAMAAARRCGAGTVVAVGRSGDDARLKAAEPMTTGD